MALLYESGCRDDKMLHLKMKDFVLNKNGEADLYVFGKGSKHCYTSISSDIMPYYREYCSLYHPEHGKNQDELLFYTVRNGVRVQMSQDNVQCFWKTYEKTPGRKIWNCHTCIHIFGEECGSCTLFGRSLASSCIRMAGHSDEMKRQAQSKLNQSEGSVFKGDVVFKYADDDGTLKKLSGLK